MRVWTRIRSNVVKLVTPRSIDREAIQWIVRMDADEPLNEAEKSALREWANRSALHQSALLRYEKFWSEADILTACKTSPEQPRLNAASTHVKISDSASR